MGMESINKAHHHELATHTVCMSSSAWGLSDEGMRIRMGMTVGATALFVLSPFWFCISSSLPCDSSHDTGSIGQLDPFSFFFR